MKNSVEAPEITTRLYPISSSSVPRKNKEQIQTILVPIDFSPDSIRALRYSVSWAEKFGSTVHVVNVRSSDEMMSLQSSDHLRLDCPDTIALLQDRLAEIQEKHNVNFLPEHAHVLTGRPFEEITRLAQFIEADLIVMPTRGQGGLKRVLLGSTAERVIRYAPCRVLVARGNAYRATFAKLARSGFTLRKILVPVDFSECSLAGVRYAAFLARSFGAKLRLLHVVFPYDQLFVDRANGGTKSLVASAQRDAQKKMKELLGEKFLRDVKCEIEIRTGSTIDEICAETARPDIDLVVTSTHGHTGFRHALIGSVAEHVARYAECPVMVVPSRGRG